MKGAGWSSVDDCGGIWGRHRIGVAMRNTLNFDDANVSALQRNAEGAVLICEAIMPVEGGDEYRWFMLDFFLSAG
jgi:hypothetical protein